MRLDGAPGGWAEMYRVYKECKVRVPPTILYMRSADRFILIVQFVEDEGDVVFYKNARGFAKMRPVFNDATASDSGIEVDK
jgi:omega-6 fatty acid desaturase (delta-12 desaturase)